MDFLLWAVRGLHVFGMVVWLGGLMYQAVVLFPALRPDEDGRVPEAFRHMLRRFQPFVWLGVWTLLVTGVALMLFSPRFVFFRYEDSWSVILGLKQLTFLVMIFFAYGQARMLALLENAGEASAVRFYEGVVHFCRVTIALGIAALLLAAAMSA